MTLEPTDAPSPAKVLFAAFAMAAMILWMLDALLPSAKGYKPLLQVLAAGARRVCPECGQESLERAVPRQSQGVRCTRCSFHDEDGLLEDFPVRERAEASDEKAA